MVSRLYSWVRVELKLNIWVRELVGRSRSHGSGYRPQSRVVLEEPGDNVSEESTTLFRTSKAGLWIARVERIRPNDIDTMVVTHCSNRPLDSPIILFQNPVC